MKLADEEELNFGKGREKHSDEREQHVQRSCVDLSSQNIRSKERNEEQSMGMSLLF